MKNIEFASKWRERLVPKLVKNGRDLAKEIAEDKKAGKVDDFDRDYYKSMISQNKDSAKQQKTKLLSGNQDDPLLKPRNVRTRESRAKYSSKNQGVGSITSNSKSYSSSNSNKSKSYKETTKAAKKVGSFIKRNKKIGLGLAGVAALGAVGYGIARKIRSDKGRKRR